MLMIFLYSSSTGNALSGTAFAKKVVNQSIHYTKDLSYIHHL